MIGRVRAQVWLPAIRMARVKPTTADGGSLSQRERVKVTENAVNLPDFGYSIV